MILSPADPAPLVILGGGQPQPDPGPASDKVADR